MELTRDSYLLSDDYKRLDLDTICRLLHDTYWAAHRPREIVEQSLQNSLCVGVYRKRSQVGFARAVTDYATFAWICDVVIAPEHRSKGLGKWMVEALVMHPSLQTTTQVLRTRDAHLLYERFGFERAEYLRRRRRDDWEAKRE